MPLVVQEVSSVYQVSCSLTVFALNYCIYDGETRKPGNYCVDPRCPLVSDRILLYLFLPGNIVLLCDVDFVFPSKIFVRNEFR